MYPAGSMLASQLNKLPEIFSEALASPAYMVATPMVRFSSNTVKKNVFIRWLLTPFKNAKKNRNTPYALHTHFTQAYRWLDTLPTTIINSVSFHYRDNSKLLYTTGNQ